MTKYLAVKTMLKEHRLKIIQKCKEALRNIEYSKQGAVQRLERYPDSQKSMGKMYDIVKGLVEEILDTNQELLELENEIRRLRAHKKQQPSRRQKSKGRKV